MARWQKTAKQRRQERRRSGDRKRPRLYAAPVIDSQVVCERCGLAQPYVTYEGEGAEVLPCAGPLGIGCGSETCVTVEAYADVHS